MLNPARQVLSKDGSIADNTYQLIGEDGVLPQGDVVLTAEQLDQLAQVSGKKALLVTVDASPETHGELRATGDVFKDVLNYMKRAGFDSFVIKEGKDVLEAAAGLGDFTHPYQASTAVAQASYQTGA